MDDIKIHFSKTVEDYDTVADKVVFKNNELHDELIKVISFSLVNESNKKKENYAVPIEQIKEIRNFSEITNVPKAKKYLLKAKKKFRIPKVLPIHCRILFSGDQRRKTGLDHISIVRIKDLITHLIEEMNKVPCLLRYAHCKVPDDGRIFLDVIDVEEKRVRDEPKGILGILSGGCFTPTNDAIQAPGIELCEIFASKDSTKIRFIGKGRCRADSYLRM